MVIIHTNFGPIKIELDTQNTAITVENFLAYAREGFYDGTKFHRVVDGFVIQGGDPLSWEWDQAEGTEGKAKGNLGTGTVGTGGPGYAFEDEINPESLNVPDAVIKQLEAAGYKPEFGEVIMKPANEVIFTGEDAVKMQKLLDALENLDDVQEVYTTAVIGED